MNNVPKKYLNKHERLVIVDALRNARPGTADAAFDNKTMKWVISKIEFWVPHTRDQVIRHGQIEVPDDFKKQFQRLPGLADKILGVMDEDFYTQVIGENPPGLRERLEQLKWMVNGGRTGSGRRQETPNRLRQELVRELAQIYYEATHQIPTTRDKEAYDPTDEAPPPTHETSFERFAAACTAPYRLNLTNYEIREGKARFTRKLASPL